MKRVKDSNELPNEWFKDGKAYLLNEPNAYYDTLWKAVLWSGGGYNLAPFLFYAPSRFSEQTLEVLVAALEADGNDNFFVDDYYFNNPDIDTSEDADVDVYDLMDEYGDIYVDATMEGASEPHVLRGENLKIEPADEPIEYYTGETISDSRRVKDDRFDDVTGEIQKGVDAYADVFYPYDQSNPENGEFFRNNKDRFKKHFSEQGVSVSERELSGRNGLYFERMKDSRRVKDSSTNVYTIEIYDDTDTEDVTPMNLQHDYYDIDEAIADLEVAMESFKDNPNEICGWVLAGEYLTEKGDVYGEPEVVYELCNY